MKPITLEWIEKAENDLFTAQRELRVKNNPNYDAVCFHAQQCAEKYLKARLQEEEIPFSKIHDLGLLLNLLVHLEPLWEPFRPTLELLTAYAVDFRYPGEIADKEDASDALQTCREMRQAVRYSFGMG